MKSQGRRSVSKVSLVTLVLASSVADAAPSTPSGRDVMVENARATSLTQLVTSSILTIGGNGESRSKSFTLWRKLAGDGVHHRTLTRFVAPAEIRGEGVLFDERTSGQNEVLLYLPRFKKVRRVEAQAQRSSFMGSSFSYADMTTQAVDDYRHDLTRTEPCPGDGRSPCFVVTSTPASQTIQTELFLRPSVSVAVVVVPELVDRHDRGGLELPLQPRLALEARSRGLVHEALRVHLLERDVASDGRSTARVT